MTTNNPAPQPPKRTWSLSQFPNDGRTPLNIGDLLRVVEIKSDVTDMHFGKCVSYELARADLAASRAPSMTRAEALDRAYKAVGIAGVVYPSTHELEIAERVADELETVSRADVGASEDEAELTVARSLSRRRRQTHRRDPR